jgi:GH15 family glucan-1,4-alpha-glucosidase
MTSLIEDYALIGDCETAALVGRNGSIDWLCWPRFDSGACFAALLGSEEHGHWLLAPSGRVTRTERRYRQDTLVLETDFETAEGLITVVDFMPVRDGVPNVIRLVLGRKGRVPMKLELVLRFDYGQVVPWVTRRPDGIRAVAGPNKVVLQSSVPLHGEDLKTVAEFTIAEGEQHAFALSYGESHLPDVVSPDPDLALSATEDFWRAWAARCSYEGHWKAAVIRSLITLKALVYAPTGGLVAAATTSLPEHVGGERNWDYRYCWLRDATLTLLALVDAGYYDEAGAWREWLLRAVAGSPAQVQIMYGLGGERRLKEWELDWLPGYEGSRPVRVGNDASPQLQLDVFGEVMDALHQARSAGLSASEAGWALECALLNHLATLWRSPDRGIWEVRGPVRHFTHSKVMAWVAFDRGIRSIEAFGLDGPVGRWRELRAEIHREVCARGFNPEIGAFVQSYDSRALDASSLLIPLVGFLPPDDPRVRSTLAAIERSLLVDGLVLRYHTGDSDDGLPAGEGAFLACSFWFVDALALDGRAEEAKRMFERLLALQNDVGLLAEEYDPRAKRQLGNFPQALSHLSLVTTALNFARGAKPREQRPESVTVPPGEGR